MAQCSNIDDGVRRSWQRKGRGLPPSQRFHWGMVHHDRLLTRQFFMMREGRHSLHNLIRGDHGLPNRY